MSTDRQLAIYAEARRLGLDPARLTPSQHRAVTLAVSTPPISTFTHSGLEEGLG